MQVAAVRLGDTGRVWRDSAVIYAENRLAAWARWAREHREILGLPTVSLLFKAMQMTKVGVIHGDAPGRLTANGTQDRGPPAKIPEPPEAIMEVDAVVARLPHKLRRVIVADYFTYGVIEVRAKSIGMKRARFCQLLEAAKFSVYVALDSRTIPGI